MKTYKSLSLSPSLTLKTILINLPYLRYNQRDNQEYDGHALHLLPRLFIVRPKSQKTQETPIGVVVAAAKDLHVSSIYPLRNRVILPVTDVFLDSVRVYKRRK